MSTSFVVNFDEAGVRRLSELAHEKHLSPSEIIRRAIATYSFLSSQVPAASGKKVSITDAEDKVVADIDLP